MKSIARATWGVIAVSLVLLSVYGAFSTRAMPAYLPPVTPATWSFDADVDGWDGNGDGQKIVQETCAISGDTYTFAYVGPPNGTSYEPWRWCVSAERRTIATSNLYHYVTFKLRLLSLTDTEEGVPTHILQLGTLTDATVSYWEPENCWDVDSGSAGTACYDPVGQVRIDENSNLSTLADAYTNYLPITTDTWYDVAYCNARTVLDEVTEKLWVDDTLISSSTCDSGCNIADGEPVTSDIALMVGFWNGGNGSVEIADVKWVWSETDICQEVAVPTDTPTPQATNTLYPTQTAYPTSTAYPVSTVQPTPTPPSSSNFTATPTLTPTPGAGTPSVTPTNTYTPSPTPGAGTPSATPVATSTSAPTSPDGCTMGECGGYILRYCVTEADGTAVQDVTVSASTAATGTAFVATGLTGADGCVCLIVPAGSYYIFRTKAGYEWTNPDRESVP